MYQTVAVAGYRSLRDVRVPLGRRVTVVTGANGVGKSNLYRALRLLAACGRGEVVGALAREGGLESVLWAGPESLAQARRGHAVQGTTRSGPVSLLLGVGGIDGELSYAADLGIPVPSASTAFNRDPEIKRELIWRGPVLRPATLSARRRQRQVEVRDDAGWHRAPVAVPTWASMLTELVDPYSAADAWAVRERLRAWRFYDGFRVDADAPARRPQVGTRTFALAEDGHDLAAALRTVQEDAPEALAAAVDDAFGAELEVRVVDGLFDVHLHSPGMLRPLRGAELSDGTLRYLLWSAALLAPATPGLMALNEPETSLHPSLVPALARTIAEASRRTQVVVVTHSELLMNELVAALGRDGVEDPRDLDPDPGEVLDLELVELEKDLGETRVRGQGLLTTPRWEWGRR